MITVKFRRVRETKNTYVFGEYDPSGPVEENFKVGTIYIRKEAYAEGEEVPEFIEVSISPTTAP